MQIPGVSLAFTWSAGFVYSEFSCVWVSATSCPLSKHTGGVDTAPTSSGLHVCLQLTCEIFLPPLYCVVFLPPPLSQAFPLLIAGRMPLLLHYSSRKDSLPPIFGTQCSPPSFQCVFIVFFVYYSVSLFSLGGGQSVQGAMLLWPRVVWEFRGTAKLTLSMSSQAVWAQATVGPGALLVSLFNVKWRCSALAGGVEGSKFCLFS
jgi:hypothetical protein